LIDRLIGLFSQVPFDRDRPVLPSWLAEIT